MGLRLPAPYPEKAEQAANQGIAAFALKMHINEKDSYKEVISLALRK